MKRWSVTPYRRTNTWTDRREGGNSGLDVWVGFKIIGCEFGEWFLFLSQKKLPVTVDRCHILLDFALSSRQKSICYLKNCFFLGCTAGNCTIKTTLLLIRLWLKSYLPYLTNHSVSFFIFLFGFYCLETVIPKKFPMKYSDILHI